MTQLDAALADLAFWFGFSYSDLEEMTLDDVERWLTQARRQIKANYTKAAI
ncbi:MULTISPECIES: GpE family phage tail protein [unclassified Pasteurella]|uniref:GpE family phage tail protein n=1 Tax=unclassified Pasteurella TaxID=2621516 RepID=UPI001073BA6E|nr:GpE family phage tail protein [Pasteurella sp. 19428wF3_WM03]TFU50487.1 GpE family phage tail protein [Pasteurella sp. WM03]